MTSKNVANLGSVVTDKTIDSQYLLEIVNQARKHCGEKEVRNNDFIYLRVRPRPIGRGVCQMSGDMTVVCGFSCAIFVSYKVRCCSLSNIMCH
ncbi:hypothetical protein GPB15_003232 [Salmonella enterica]|nr:hypothetical protein [Salmonella enterica]EAQ6496370.1 hypothetical protein [Salmonella enterica]EDE9647625.1 hypothetical protein [Salmonella enterica]EDZ4390317.1 hypothetical protein [Salmonella enterica]